MLVILRYHRLHCLMTKDSERHSCILTPSCNHYVVQVMWEAEHSDLRKMLLHRYNSTVGILPPNHRFRARDCHNRSRANLVRLHLHQLRTAMDGLQSPLLD